MLCLPTPDHSWSQNLSHSLPLTITPKWMVTLTWIASRFQPWPLDSLQALLCGKSSSMSTTHCTSRDPGGGSGRPPMMAPKGGINSRVTLPSDRILMLC